MFERCFCSTVGGELTTQTYRFETERAGKFEVDVRIPKPQLNMQPDPEAPCFIYQQIAQLTRSGRLESSVTSGPCHRCAGYMTIVVRKIV